MERQRREKSVRACVFIRVRKQKRQGVYAMHPNSRHARPLIASYILHGFSDYMPTCPTFSIISQRIYTTHAFEYLENVIYKRCDSHAMTLGVASACEILILTFLNYKAKASQGERQIIFKYGTTFSSWILKVYLHLVKVKVLALTLWLYLDQLSKRNWMPT